MLSLEILKNKIKEIAIKYCNDYPEIETISTYEQLYALESTLEGTNNANKDCHKIIKHLSNKINLSTENLCLLWDSIIEENKKRSNKKYIILEGLELKNRFFTINDPNKTEKEQCLCQGEITYKCLGYADSISEAQMKIIWL